MLLSCRNSWDAQSWVHNETHKQVLNIVKFHAPYCNPVGIVSCQGLMYSNGFPLALDNFQKNRASDPAKAVVLLWNSKMPRTIDTIVLKGTLWQHEDYIAAWYSEKLPLMKWARWRLEKKWCKSLTEADQTCVRMHNGVTHMAVKAPKNWYSAASMGFFRSWPGALLCVVQRLVTPDSQRPLTMESSSISCVGWVLEALYYNGSAPTCIVKSREQHLRVLFPPLELELWDYIGQHFVSIAHFHSPLMKPPRVVIRSMMLSVC